MKIKKEDLNVDDFNILNNMAINALSYVGPSEIVVRGGIASCSAGSHFRYLDQPVSHGVTVGENPVLLESDCTIDENIYSFGLCAIKTMSAVSDESFVNASSMPGMLRENALTRGIPCTPNIIGEWNNVDNTTVVYNKMNLKEEGQVLMNSNAVCAYGELINLKASGQIIDFFKMKKDYLSDHEECKVETKEYDAVQVNVNKDNVNIDVYIKIMNLDQKLQSGESEHDLILDGIKAWGGIYSNVFGHKATVTINVNEYEEAWAIEKKQHAVKINNYNKPGDTTSGLVSNFDYSDNRYMDIHDRSSYIDEHGDSKLNYISAKYYRNAVTHEFGHAMGLEDAYDHIGKSDLEVNEKDIMTTKKYDEGLFIDPINIQMVISAGKNREMQFYTGTKKSKGAKRYETCKYATK